MYGWSGVSDQFWLCFFVSSFIKSHSAFIFSPRFIILLHFLFTRSLLVPYTYVCFYQVNWFHLFIIIWTWSNLVNFFSENIVPFTFKTLLHFLKNCLWFSLILSMSILFFLYNLFCSPVELLMNSFYNHDI